MEESLCKFMIVPLFLLIIRDEFVMKYLETRQRLTDRLNDVCKKITEHKRQRDEMA